MKTFEEKLRDYARLIIEVGINVEKDKPISLAVPVDNAKFARMLAKSAYEKGASEVDVIWTDDFMTRARFEYQSEENLGIIPTWSVDKAMYYAEQGGGRVVVVADDPELLAGIDPKKIEVATKARRVAFKEFMKYSMNDINSWCVVAIPSKAWAEKVFPDKKGEEAINALWDAIFEATRMNEADPVEAWKKHLDDLAFRSKYLNEQNFDHLIYKSSNGTDLKVGLPKGHIWVSGSSENSRGVEFVANMPTEEVFTAPDNRRIEGKLISTKPLAYAGNIIDGFELEFKDGAVVSYKAEKGENYLKDLLETDENAKRIGEIALVPYDSPISNSGILFFNTLFDENASCHFAFGKAYPTNVKGGVDMNEEELKEAGINDSLVHEDFMVGAKDLSIIGVKEDGSQVKIFENGNWAF